MNNFDLRQLRYFVAVAEELHFGRAALRLHISQPPLSQQIAALEANLGVKLFNRTKHKVEITTAGSQLLKDARALLGESRKIAARTKAAAEGQIGTLHIGLNYTAPLNPALSKILHQFSKAYPNVGLEFHENTSENQLNCLINHTLDLCFVWPTLNDKASPIQLHNIHTDPMRFVMRDDHPLARKKEIIVEDIKNYPLFLTRRQTRMAFYDALSKLCKKAKFTPDIRTDIIQLPFILNFVATGDALALLPEFLTAIKPKNVLFKNCDFLPASLLQMPLAVAHHKDNRSVLVQNFLNCLLKN